MISPPLALIAEVTHRCPLHCVYCSNPLELKAGAEELPTETWARVFEEGAELGLFHVHFTGGEPLARNDLAQLVSVAHSLRLYTNLITSGIGLNEKKLAALMEAGLDHLQMSFQDAEEGIANWIAGAPVHARKLALADLIRASRGLAFTVNLVVHRHNLDRLDSLISFAESLGPQRIEIVQVRNGIQQYRFAKNLCGGRIEIRVGSRCSSTIDRKKAKAQSTNTSWKNSHKVWFVSRVEITVH